MLSPLENLKSNKKYSLRGICNHVRMMRFTPRKQWTNISNIFTKLRNKNTKVGIHKRQNQESINLVQGDGTSGGSWWQVGLDEISGWAGGIFSKPTGWSNRIWKLVLHLHGTRTGLIQPAQSLAWGRPDTISLAVIFLQRAFTSSQSTAGWGRKVFMKGEFSHHAGNCTAAGKGWKGGLYISQFADMHTKCNGSVLKWIQKALSTF